MPTSLKKTISETPEVRLSLPALGRINRPLLSLILGLLLMETLIGVFLHHDWKDKETQYLGQQTVGLETAYRSSVQMYALATELLFDEIIHHPDVTDILRSASAETDEDARGVLRGKLYRLLYPTYAQLKQNNMRQFHFHLQNGESFLRFHDPAKFGDMLFDARPSVRIANTEKKPVSGFEVGRVLSGFRYVFPVLVDGEHLGSLEASVSFRAIREAMASLEKTREYAFLLRRSSLDGVLDPDQLNLYGPASLHADYLVEDPELKLPDSPPPPSERVQELNAKLAKMETVRSGMREGRAMTVKVEQDGKTWAVSFLPVRDVLNKQVAYVVAYSEAPLAVLFMRDYVVSMLASVVLLFVVALLFGHLLRSRAALEAEKRNLKVVTDTVADGLYAMDASGRLTLLNPSAEMLLGFSEREVLGEIGHDLFHSHAVNDHVPKEHCPIYRKVSRGLPFDGEEHFARKDGEHLPVEVASRPILDRGQIAGSVTVFRDITERKKVEIALTEAKQAAENANQMKSEFLANMSHEIRTPMNGIIGLTQLALEGELLPEQREHLVMVGKSADTLMTIINDILDFSKIEAGQLTIEHTPFALRQTVKSALQPLDIQARQKGLVLNLKIDADVPDRLIGDPVRLNQVLINLVGNALKFTSQGEIEVHLALARPLVSSLTSSLTGQDERAEIVFGVRDTGTGIPQSKLGTIFESFSQVDASITRRFGGTGLGLTIVRRLVRLMGGDVSVESELGQGSRFYFCLGFALDQSAPPVFEAAETRPLSGPLHVLLVEDNAVNRKLATTLLGKAGHQVSVAVDGGEAVALLTRQHDYDVVLLDVQMPVMDGTQVAEAVRLHEALYGGHLPIIALTANAMVGDRERFLASGMDDYVSKPINVQELMAALARVGQTRVG